MFKYFILFLLSCTLYQGDEVAITWQSDLELQWSDFKAEPRPQDNAAAVTASGISFGFSSTKSSTKLIDFTYEITAQFYPERSWRVNAPLSDVVLAHERLHFDITELFARKFRQGILNTEFTMNINIEIERIYNTINTELDEMQKRYDVETNHSQNIEQQREWQNRISQEIEKLSYYQ